jgi:putative ABC transport system permease protein
MSVIEGRLPAPRTNEIIVAKAVALNHGLNIGDTIKLPHYILYGAEQAIIFGEPVEMEIVGLLERGSPTRGGQSLSNEMWMSFASYEFMSNHESVSSRRIRLFVIPTEGNKVELDRWLEKNVASKQTIVSTYASRYIEISEMLRNLTLSFTAIEIGIALIAAISVAVMNYILFTQRREEFGILNALGGNRPWLVMRTAKEIGSIVAFAWLISVAIYGVGLALIQAAVYAPKGIQLNILNPIPWLFTVPIPLTIILTSAGTIAWVLIKLDPVTIIERR